MLRNDPSCEPVFFYDHDESSWIMGREEALVYIISSLTCIEYILSSLTCIHKMA